MLGVGVSEESRCVVCKTRASGQEPTVEGLIHQCVVYTFMSNAVKVLNCSRLPCPTSDCCCPAAQLRTRSQPSSCSTTVSALPPTDVGYLHSSAIFQSVNVSQLVSSSVVLVCLLVSHVSHLLVGPLPPSYPTAAAVLPQEHTISQQLSCNITPSVICKDTINHLFTGQLCLNLQAAASTSTCCCPAATAACHNCHETGSSQSTLSAH